MKIKRGTGSIRRQLADIANKPTTPSTVLALSESIMAVSNFQSQLSTLLGGATVLDSAYGGSHIGTQLAEMADEIWIPQIGDNQLLYSNDISHTGSPGWQLESSGVCTATQEYLSDGTLWNKVVKTDNASYGGPWYVNLLYPTGATGIFVSFELYIPIGTTPAPMTSLRVCCHSASGQDYNLDLTNLIPGKKQKYSLWFPASAMAWVKNDGSQIQLQFRMNNADSFAACTAYFRNVELSWFAPCGYQEYAGTTSPIISAGSIAWAQVCRNQYNYRDIDCVVSSSGRNESNYGEDPYCHHRAYDKLIIQCTKFGQTVVIGNCPPHKDAATDAWSATEKYDSNYHNQFKRLIAKWNCGVDIWQIFKDLVSSGVYTPAGLMMDEWHENTVGAGILTAYYADEIQKKHKPLNTAQPMLKNSVKYYIAGIPTGSWVPTTKYDWGVEARLLGGQSWSMVSSTQNDTLLFSNVTAEQLHVIYREDAAYGTFDLIVDEGTAKQKTYTFNCGNASDRVQARFVCDYLDSGTHTVKIKVTSTGKSVRIHGIVTI